MRALVPDLPDLVGGTEPGAVYGHLRTAWRGLRAFLVGLPLVDAEVVDVTFRASNKVTLAAHPLGRPARNVFVGSLRAYNARGSSVVGHVTVLESPAASTGQAAALIAHFDAPIALVKARVLVF